QRVVHFLEDLAGFGKGFGKVTAHADGLAALARKGKGDAHRRLSPDCVRDAAQVVAQRQARVKPFARGLPKRGLTFCQEMSSDERSSMASAPRLAYMKPALAPAPAPGCGVSAHGIPFNDGPHAASHFHFRAFQGL